MAVHFSAHALRRGMWLWPPFLGAGISVIELDKDFTRLTSRLRSSRLSRNNQGTQFGGSILSLTDPFFAIMLLHHLGKDHYVWDRAVEAEFIAPGRTALTAHFAVTPELVAEIREAAATGEKVLRWLEVDVTDAAGDVVARVRKQLYIRQRKHLRANAT
ncbi:DUF4442 domain-containing protein [Leucobacter sp. M11]|uniref:DUF4442 domain-containing protein n=1 Tax=Leucobacter sp. M11 TaxID=2993565 RepID=UPI002D7FE5A7|nr:DUF4442 domain-containing protein [Leucobacter sp. M11]MEB4613414.1 DUF4442 domain-containing protein [Leucobacter sp. M11]